MPERKYFHDLFGGEASAGSIVPAVILVNDPLSVPLLCKELEGVTSVANHYEFRVMTGSWQGVPISICSTGIGGGSASIAMDNIVRLGAQTVIYVDAAQMEISAQRVWAAAGAVRQDGASLDYVHAQFPAAADAEVLLAVLAAARELNIPVAPALLWASAGPLSAERRGVIELYRDHQKSFTNRYSIPLVPSPAEPATILTLATLYRVRAGAIYANLVDLSQQEAVLRQIFRLALSSQHLLQTWDAIKDRNGWKIMTPPSRLSEEKNE